MTNMRSVNITMIIFATGEGIHREKNLPIAVKNSIQLLKNVFEIFILNYFK